MEPVASGLPPEGGRRVLVVDDDGHIREVLSYALSKEGYQITEARDGRAALEALEVARSRPETAFDLVILDIVMPGIDGLEVCRAIRRQSTVPIVFLSSKDDELDRVLGLEMGADDYVPKPFSPRELIARCRAALRRYDEIRALLTQGDAGASGASSKEEAQLRFGELVLDLQRHECRVAGGTVVVLTVSEFGLLRALLTRPGHVLSRAQLVQQAYGEVHFLSDRTVDSHMRRIRRKLRDAGLDVIETVYGVGYRLGEG